MYVSCGLLGGWLLTFRAIHRISIHFKILALDMIFLTPAEVFTRPDQWIPFADCFSNPESSGHVNAYLLTLCPSELADRRFGWRTNFAEAPIVMWSFTALCPEDCMKSVELIIVISFAFNDFDEKCQHLASGTTFTRLSQSKNCWSSMGLVLSMVQAPSRQNHCNFATVRDGSTSVVPWGVRFVSLAASKEPRCIFLLSNFPLTTGQFHRPGVQWVLRMAKVLCFDSSCGVFSSNWWWQAPFVLAGSM